MRQVSLCGLGRAGTSDCSAGGHTTCHHTLLPRMLMRASLNRFKVCSLSGMLGGNLYFSSNFFFNIQILKQRFPRLVPVFLVKISYFCSFCSWSKPLTSQMIIIVSVAVITGGCLGTTVSSWLYDLSPECLRLVHFLICKMGIRILSRIQRPVRLNCCLQSERTGPGTKAIALHSPQ